MKNASLKSCVKNLLSAALLSAAAMAHANEAAPVTRGARYVLLTFLHDDAAELRRRQGLALAAQAARLEAPPVVRVVARLQKSYVRVGDRDVLGRRVLVQLLVPLLQPRLVEALLRGVLGGFGGTF